MASLKAIIRANCALLSKVLKLVWAVAYDHVVFLCEPVYGCAVSFDRLRLAHKRLSADGQGVLRHEAVLREAPQRVPHKPGVPVLDKAGPVHVEPRRGGVAVGELPLLEDQVIHCRQHLPGHTHARHAGELGNVIVLEVPEVRVDLQLVVRGYTEPAEGVREGLAGGADGELYLGLVLVVNRIE